MNQKRIFAFAKLKEKDIGDEISNAKTFFLTQYWERNACTLHWNYVPCFSA